MTDFAGHFRAGIDHFNATEFWHAHEDWETVWREAGSDVRPFLQGLIQLAAAYHHVKRGTWPGGLRLFAAGLEKLQPFPLRWGGIDRTNLEAAARRHRQWVQELLERGATGERLDANAFPRIVTEDSTALPFEHW